MRHYIFLYICLKFSFQLNTNEHRKLDMIFLEFACFTYYLSIYTFLPPLIAPS